MAAEWVATEWGQLGHGDEVGHALDTATHDLSHLQCFWCVSRIGAGHLVENGQVEHPELLKLLPLQPTDAANLHRNRKKSSKLEITLDN